MNSDRIRELFALPQVDFDVVVLKNMKHKTRSHDTHHNNHIPALSSLPPNSLTTCLIGDSRMERFKWFCPLSQMNNLPHSFNAGCGGDQIQHVLYRISEGLLLALSDKPPRLWILSIGTNNLHAKVQKQRPFGMFDEDIEKFAVLLVALLRVAPGSRVLMTEMSYRRVIRDEIVDVENARMKGVVARVNEAWGRESVLWNAMPKRIAERENKDKYLLDRVHFNEEGYRIWDAALWSDVQKVLASFEQMDGGIKPNEEQEKDVLAPSEPMMNDGVEPGKQEFVFGSLTFSFPRTHPSILTTNTDKAVLASSEPTASGGVESPEEQEKNLSASADKLVNGGVRVDEKMEADAEDKTI
jgi:hypothetical protein